jgi:hypothetical protein
MSRHTRSRRTRRLAAVLLVALAAGLVSCSPYASLNLSAPFKVGPVYVSPSIGVGGFL